VSRCENCDHPVAAVTNYDTIPMRDLYDVLARTFHMSREDVEKRPPLRPDTILVLDLYEVLARAFRAPRDEIKKRLLGACYGK
jgi:hypothetical protein